VKASAVKDAEAAAAMTAARALVDALMRCEIERLVGREVSREFCELL